MNNFKIISAKVADYCENEESPTITVLTEINGEEFTWDIQTTDCKYKTELGCLTHLNDEEYDGEEHEQYFSEVIEAAEAFAAQSVLELAIDKIKTSGDSEEIASKAEAIQRIIGSGDVDDYLMLAKTFVRSDSISINDTMIFLQIRFSCTQEQSKEVIELF